MGPVFRFFDSRLGLSQLAESLLTGKYPPRTTSWLHTLGFAAFAVFVAQLITGVALAFHYVPSADHAYDSLRVLERDVPGGALLRGLHHWGSSAMVVLLFLHGLRVFLHGCYKKPRELTWILGLGLLAIVLGLSFTGYLLPWDQKAYFATKVGVNIASRAPLVGETLRSVLSGGPEIGPVTLNRFFALHVLVLPGMLLVLLALHLMQIQRHGITPVGARVGEAGIPGPAYHPGHTVKEGLVAALALSLILMLALRLGAPLEAEAEAVDPTYQPRPDWYFAGAFELLKFFEGPMEAVGTFWLPLALGLLLTLLPFLDRNPERSTLRRPIARVAALVFVTLSVGLTTAGLLDRPTHWATPPHPLGASERIRLGYDLVRRENCLSCHTVTTEVTTYGKSESEAPDFADVEMETEELVEFLLDPDSDVMPDFKHLSEPERRAIGAYLLLLRPQ
ncbi:MAG: cytochrome b N-terminal domain-containing protein [Planctomycetota bacterium]